jgi:hypothetical protein
MASINLTKPKALRDLPKDPEEAFVEVLRRLGPCNTQEMKWALGSRVFCPYLWMRLVRLGVVIITQERPRIFDLPENQPYI